MLTVDFFPPIVDDPFTFGQVAAANALSDVYAMGGRPITALNLLMVPAKMPPDIAANILRGGGDKIAEAGAVIAGGHSVKDNELKYGLSVTGLIHPDKIIKNIGARVGDRLILTKPLGSGIVSTAVKQNKAAADHVAALTANMIALNKAASEAMVALGAHAATDITGFGLAGHGYEMASGSGVTCEIEFAALKLLPGTIEYVKAGALTGGANATRMYLANKICLDSSLPDYASHIIHDPQTSGGLLIAIAPDKANELMARLSDAGVDAADIGRVVEKSDISIRFF